MSYVYQTWIADALRAEGCKVIEESGWKNRGRPSSSGSFNPYGVTNHHTGTRTSRDRPHPTLNMCINGRPGDLPGPLCQVMICYIGECHVIAAGRANHAGKCNGWGPFQTGDGNWQTIGFEIDYNGTQDMSPDQWDAVLKANAAMLRHFEKPVEYMTSHHETSVTGKWDPGYHGSKANMNNWRTAVGKLLTPAPPIKPPPVTTAKEDIMPVLWASDGAGPSGTIYAVPLDLSYKVPVDKVSYDAINAAMGKAGYGSGNWAYVRVDISPALLEAIPLVQTDALYITADGEPGVWLAPPDLRHKIWVTDGTTKNALDQTKVAGKGRYDEVKVSATMLNNIPTIGREP